MEFQIVDILSDDLPYGSGKEFIITLYGKTKENKTVVCNVGNFKPYFYLKIPNKWKETKVNRFLGDNDVKGNIETLITGYKNYDPKKDLLKIGPENIKSYKELYGFLRIFNYSY